MQKTQVLTGWGTLETTGTELPTESWGHEKTGWQRQMGTGKGKREKWTTEVLCSLTFSRKLGIFKNKGHGEKGFEHIKGKTEGEREATLEQTGRRPGEAGNKHGVKRGGETRRC